MRQGLVAKRIDDSVEVQEMLLSPAMVTVRHAWLAATTCFGMLAPLHAHVTFAAAHTCCTLRLACKYVGLQLPAASGSKMTACQLTRRFVLNGGATRQGFCNSQAAWLRYIERWYATKGSKHAIYSVGRWQRLCMYQQLYNLRSRR
jgi:hypothetical protein